MEPFVTWGLDEHGGHRKYYCMLDDLHDQIYDGYRRERILWSSRKAQETKLLQLPGSEIIGRGSADFERAGRGYIQMPKQSQSLNIPLLSAAVGLGHKLEEAEKRLALMPQKCSTPDASVQYPALATQKRGRFSSGPGAYNNAPCCGPTTLSPTNRMPPVLATASGTVGALAQHDSPAVSSGLIIGIASSIQTSSDSDDGTGSDGGGDGIQYSAE
eukprot:1192746-Pyramimonas_sp.AAC.1